MAVKSAFYKRSDGRWRVDKAPGDELPYGFTAKGWVDFEGDTFASVDWTVAAGLTQGAEHLENDLFWTVLGGGEAGTAYQVDAVVTTGLGRKLHRQFLVVVKAL